MTLINCSCSFSCIFFISIKSHNISSAEQKCRCYCFEHNIVFELYCCKDKIHIGSLPNIVNINSKWNSSISRRSPVLHMFWSSHSWQSTISNLGAFAIPLSPSLTISTFFRAISQPSPHPFIVVSKIIKHILKIVINIFIITMRPINSYDSFHAFRFRFGTVLFTGGFTTIFNVVVAFQAF
jgi:hypothetical protein